MARERIYNYKEEGIKIVIKAIRLAKIDIYKEYDLYPITLHIEELVSLKKEREKRDINTIGQVLDVINHIKKNKLI